LIGIEMPVTIKKLDGQGRVVVPKKWRDKHGGGKVLLELEKDRITITPLDQVDLTEYFDPIEVDVEGDLPDWHAVKRELRERSP